MHKVADLVQQVSFDTEHDARDWGGGGGPKKTPSFLWKPEQIPDGESILCARLISLVETLCHRAVIFSWSQIWIALLLWLGRIM